MYYVSQQQKYVANWLKLKGYRNEQYQHETIRADWTSYMANRLPKLNLSNQIPEPDRLRRTVNNINQQADDQPTFKDFHWWVKVSRNSLRGKTGTAQQTMIFLIVPDPLKFFTRN